MNRMSVGFDVEWVDEIGKIYNFLHWFFFIIYFLPICRELERKLSIEKKVGVTNH